MEFSIIVAVYNRPDYLWWCLKSLKHQNFKEFEVIVADDGSSGEKLEKIREYIEYFKNFYPIKYVWHEDKGNRKSLILNKAVKISKGDSYIFLDSDVIVERKFLEKYRDYFKKYERLKRFFFTGNVIFLSKRISDIIIKNKELKYEFVLKFIEKNFTLAEKLRYYFNVFKYLFEDFTKFKYPKGWGTNLAISKEAFYSVNGFNNEWFGRNEDSDLMRRMVLAGAKRISLNHTVKVYHLEHGRVFEPEHIRKEKRKRLKLEYYRANPHLIVTPNGVSQVDPLKTL